MKNLENTSSLVVQQNSNTGSVKKKKNPIEPFILHLLCRNPTILSENNRLSVGKRKIIVFSSRRKITKVKRVHKCMQKGVSPHARSYDYITI